MMTMARAWEVLQQATLQDSPAAVEAVPLQDCAFQNVATLTSPRVPTLVTKF
jgi:hypothetical protein